MTTLPVPPENLPVSAAHNAEDPNLPFVVVDVHGTVHARYATQVEAETDAADTNAGLPQEVTHATAAEPVQEEPVQQKEKPMPRGIPKRKAKKRSAPKPVVKKAAKKTMKPAAKRRKKRRVIG